MLAQISSVDHLDCGSLSSMQTFLPYVSFSESAKVLDYRRLGKQRVEAMQILNTLEGRSGGWLNHPAVKMWRGYEGALKEYSNSMINEWVSRGYKNTMKLYDVDACMIPKWLGDSRVHSSHRGNLIRKDPVYYGSLSWVEDPVEGYFWPV